METTIAILKSILNSKHDFNTLEVEENTIWGDTYDGICERSIEEILDDNKLVGRVKVNINNSVHGGKYWSISISDIKIKTNPTMEKLLGLPGLTIVADFLSTVGIDIEELSLESGVKVQVEIRKLIERLVTEGRLTKTE